MGLLLRPVRTALLLALAFAAGIFWERSNQGDRCLDAGGALRNGLCIGARE
ncbi:hypothetical protein [Pukyongiella litopenaei]|uniref:hypothetical protein n=1 Tax=Pukyongiella litopenaei TaxID=2605946 RepID=UPI001B80141D|nr:hypothetical protein [Pukyongiella litopenaei]